MIAEREILYKIDREGDDLVGTVELLLKDIVFFGTMSTHTGSMPIFQWEIKSNKGKLTQRAFQFRVKNGGEVFWDSRQIYTSQQKVIYRGMYLQKETNYQWELIVWTNSGDVAYAEGEFQT